MNQAQPHNSGPASGEVAPDAFKGPSAHTEGESRKAVATAGGSDSSLRIDPSQRKSWTSIAFIRAGAMFAAPSLMVGATLGQGLSLGGCALAVIVAFGFIALYMSFVSMQAADLGLSTVHMAEQSLGKLGARYFVSLLVGVVTIGWFGVQTAICGASLSLMLGDLFSLAVPTWACSALLGALMLATAVLGFEGLRWLNSVAAPLLMAICLYGVGASLAETGGMERLLGYVPLPGQSISFVAGLNMAVGLCAFAGATSGDFARFAKSRKDAFISSFVGLLPAALVSMTSAAALAILLGESDIAVIMNSIGLPAVGLIALVLSAWTVNASNVYSAGIGFSIMLGRESQKDSKVITAVSGIVGIALAVVGILDWFQSFLTILSAAGPSLAGVMVADYWIVRKARPENRRVDAGVNPSGVIGIAVGLLVGLVTGGGFAGMPLLGVLDLPFFIGPVNSIVATLIAYSLAYRLLGKERFGGPIQWTRPLGE